MDDSSTVNTVGVAGPAERDGAAHAMTAAPRQGTTDTGGKLGWRAARTRAAILEASKQLFLERGYAGTRINNITDACGISRAGFYTYFKDKREIFNTLGEEAYREVLAVVEAWEDLPRPCARADVESWIWKYFAYMDKHGAFVLSAQSGPADEAVGTASRRMQMRVAWLLGVHLRGRQRTPTEAPEALGLAVQSMIDRAWYHCHVQDLPVDDEDMVTTIGGLVLGVLNA